MSGKVNVRFKHTCEMCGQEFEAKSKAKRFCDREHYGTCCICGKQFLLPNNNLAYYLPRLDHIACKGKCQHELSVRSSGLTQEELTERKRQSMIRKYGVENPGQLKSVIEKREQTSLARYGTRHASQSEQAKAKRKATCLDRYGVEHVTQSEQFKIKSRETCQAKEGVDFPSQMSIMKQHTKETMLQRYGVEHAMQSPEIKERRRQSNLSKYGVESPTQLEEVKQKIQDTMQERYGDPHYSNPEKRKQTCLERYGTEYYLQSEECREATARRSIELYGVDHHLKARPVIEKRQQTCFKKYGATNVLASEHGINASQQTLMQKYGVINPSQNPEFKAKATRNARKSKLEIRICTLFENYEIEYKHHHIIRDAENNLSHEFDFYLPKYKLLIDADGLYFHAYLNDPNGKQSNDYYDDIRISLVPKNHIFHVIVEGTEDEQVKQLVKILKDVDADIFDYDSYLFNWCRSIEFPYPHYTDKRLVGDWTSLCKYQNVRYVQQCRIGESIIKHFHRSIFSCRVKKCVSPLEAWYDDTLLKKVITNRLIYINDVDPSKILRGFNISKICPVVSMFNPILAKYLVVKYLSDFYEVFDPFSGFSGRLLGVASAGKKYIGQDLNPKVVAESGQIISYLHIDSDSYSVVEKDILESSGEYECLLTCPPYDHKEVYNKETVFKSCDEWIGECLSRFQCKRYVFVVDETVKYADHVAEVIKSTSHFASVQEKVIVID